jgi:cupin 2 domain-containing protein
MHNLFAEVAESLPEERIDVLVRAERVRLERIVSTGHTTPAGAWYDQATDEWVVLLRGGARLRFEDQEALVQMRPGDYLHVAAHRRHRVEWTDPREPTVWLALHYGQTS